MLSYFLPDKQLKNKWIYFQSGQLCVKHKKCISVFHNKKNGGGKKHKKKVQGLVALFRLLNLLFIPFEPTKSIKHSPSFAVIFQIY